MLHNLGQKSASPFLRLCDQECTSAGPLESSFIKYGTRAHA